MIQLDLGYPFENNHPQTPCFSIRADIQLTFTPAKGRLRGLINNILCDIFIVSTIDSVIIAYYLKTTSHKPNTKYNHA